MLQHSVLAYADITALYQAWFLAVNCREMPITGLLGLSLSNCVAILLFT
jgi:hypothetical protein